MRILHTSDWHIGRTFHGNSTVAHLREVLAAMVEIVEKGDVDVVVVAGDIFDSATPAAECFDVLTETLTALKRAGATVIMTSGNHDSATRLGFQSGFAGLAGIHIITRPEQHDQPISLGDDHGVVNFYGIPYLEPSMVRHLFPDAPMRNHEDVLGHVMGRIRADIAAREGRSVVLSHAFIVNVPASDVERDITAGGLDYVPLSTFDGADYVALGHIHGQATLSERVRYSGAPLHYSFSEADKSRGGWLVDLDGAGLERVEWVDFPVPRALTVLTGTLDELMTDAAYRDAEDHWISAILTDTVRPLDAMRRLQVRFPNAAHLEHRPVLSERSTETYAERVRSKSDSEIVDGFLGHVRNGVGATDAERTLIATAITETETERVA
jgi:exonuclease SbcD